MAISLTERFKSDIGGKQLIMYECTLAADTNAITAASLELTYIESSWISPMKQTLSAGSVTGLTLKYGAASTGITISGVRAANDKVMLCVIGW